MGGEDWKRWIDQLADAGVLAPGFRTLNYTYIGSELTWPIYWKGTLGRAKVDLDRKAEEIRSRLGEDAARVVALKAVVTQASSAIPVVPLYGTVLFKVMKQLGLPRRMHRTDRPSVPHPPRRGCRSRRGEAPQGRRLGAIARSSERGDAAMAAALHRNARRTGRPSGIQEPIPAPVRIWHRRRRLRPGRRSPRRRVEPLLCMGLFSRFCVWAVHPAAIFSARWNAGRAAQRSI